MTDETAKAVTPYWPKALPRSLARPYTTLVYNLEVSAARYGKRPAIEFFGTSISYARYKAEVDAFAGWLAEVAGVARGDRVVLFLQNSPQYLIAYHGILRADAVVVPVNPMNRAGELSHYLADSGAVVAVCAQDLAESVIEAARGASALKRIVVATYSDYLPAAPEFELGDWLTAPRETLSGCTAWREAINAGRLPGPPAAQPDDLALMPYTSGLTGQPKGCMHSHQSFMHTAVGQTVWHRAAPGTVYLGVAPMYHVTGLGHCVNAPTYSGGTVVILPRWQRDLAARLVERYGVEHMSLAPTAIIDLLASPDIERYDLSSVRRVTSGGAAMSDAVWKRMYDLLGIQFIEAYGMTESAATTHLNPVERPKRQCLGIPFFDTEARIIDPDTLAVLGPEEPGEIVMRGPQIFKGYWNQPRATADAFVEIEGRRWYRSGDLGYVDGEGYYFMTDRLKRMINASGFKVWPAEVETMLYRHPDVLEACVVGVNDPYRGETVKALVVLKPGSRGRVHEEDIVAWSREQMAAYKYPRIVELMDTLPKSGAGKILWRQLQEAENAKREGKKA